MAGLKFTIICISTAICWGSVLSASATWKEAMGVCISLNQLPSSEDNATKNGSWVGKVKYSSLFGGSGTLQIQRVGKNETCSDCDDLTKQCKFCNSRIQLPLDGSVASLDVFRTLKPGRKYILAKYKKETIDAIPSPSQCMVHRGASHTEYITCSEEFEDGCIKNSGDISDTYITICVDVYATTQANMNVSGCTSQQGNNVNKGSTQPQGHVLICLILILVQVHLREIWN